MSKKRFTGVRRRVEGERARHAARVIVERGYTIRQEGRLGDDTGYIIRTVEGPVINLYDTGSILISGNNRHQFGSVDELRFPETSAGVLILANEEDGALQDVTGMLTEWGIAVERVYLGSSTWMTDVANARKRGLHVVMLVSGSSFAVGDARRAADPATYFAFGVLVARLDRQSLTVICDEAVEMPPRSDLLGTVIIRYEGDVSRSGGQLKAHLEQTGVRFGAGGNEAMGPLFGME